RVRATLRMAIGAALLLSLAVMGLGPSTVIGAMPELSQWAPLEVPPNSAISPSPGYLLRTYEAQIDAVSLEGGVLVWEGTPSAEHPGGYLLLPELSSARATLTTRFAFDPGSGS